MKLILHHFWKDVRALRWMLAVWLLVVVTDTVLGCLSVLPDYATASRANRASASPLVYLLGAIAWILLIVRLVQTEPMSGTTSFWRTRPTPPWVLIASKLLFILLLAIFPSVFIHGLEVTLYRLPAGAAHEIVRNAFFLECLTLPLILWMAAQTRNLAQFWIAICLLLVSFTIYTTFALNRYLPIDRHPGLTAARWEMGGLLFYGGLIVSLLLHYGFRNARAGFWVGFLSIVLSSLIGVGWPFVWRPFSTVSLHSPASVPIAFHLKAASVPDWSQTEALGTTYQDLSLQGVPAIEDSRGIPVVEWTRGSFFPAKARRIPLDSAIVPTSSLMGNVLIDWSPELQKIRPDLTVGPVGLPRSQALRVQVPVTEASKVKGQRGFLILQLDGRFQTLKFCGAMPLGGERFVRLPGLTLWATPLQADNGLSLQLDASGFTKERTNLFSSLVFLLVDSPAHVGIVAQRFDGRESSPYFFGTGEWGRTSGSQTIGYSPEPLSQELRTRLRPDRIKDWTLEIYEIVPGAAFDGSLNVPDIQL